MGDDDWFSNEESDVNGSTPVVETGVAPAVEKKPTKKSEKKAEKSEEVAESETPGEADDWAVQGAVASPQPSASDYKFTMDEAEAPSKVIITVCGEKGEGKTMTALSFIRSDKTVLVIQFDENAAPIKKYFYKDSPRIIIHSGIKYMSNDAEQICEAGFKTIKYLEFLLEQYYKEPPNGVRPDYVIIDGFEILSTIAEFAMRYNNKLKPFQGVKNLNIWKERRGYLKQIHNLARQAATEGVIYTVYMDQVDAIISEGQVQDRKTEPKWVDVIKYETHITLHAYSKMKDNEKKFFVEVLSSKLPKLMVTGKKFDVTNSPLMLRAPAQSPTTPPEKKPSVPVQTSLPKKEEPKPEETRPELKIVKPKKAINKLPPKEEEKGGDSDTLTDPTGKLNDVVEEIASQATELKKRTDEANTKSQKKAIETAQRAIMESLNSDFESGEAMTTKLKEKVVATGLVSGPAFDKAMKNMLDTSGEVYESRLGYVKKVASTEEEKEIEETTQDDEPTEEEYAESVIPPEVVKVPQKKISEEKIKKTEVKEESKNAGEFETW